MSMSYKLGNISCHNLCKNRFYPFCPQRKSMTMSRLDTSRFLFLGKGPRHSRHRKIFSFQRPTTYASPVSRSVLPAISDKAGNRSSGSGNPQLVMSFNRENQLDDASSARDSSRKLSNILYDFVISRLGTNPLGICSEALMLQNC
jgi:hypothetical protein